MSQVYQYLKDHETTVRAIDYFQFDVPQDVEFVSIWQGYTKVIAQELDIPPYLVAQAITNLCYVESIRRLYKGSHGHPSVYHLIEPPEENKYQQMQVRSYTTGIFRIATPTEKLQDAVSKLSNQVYELHQKVERLELLVQANDASRNPRWRN